jgi:oligoribonuclease (3'-5' exoribonuclease)
MDEGVDPTHLSQGLMNKVAQSEQLQSVAAPEVLVLFEDWLEELETEVAMLAKKAGTPEPRVLGKKLGISEAGASFLITKLKREKKL